VIAGACYEVSPYLIAHTFEGHYPHVWAACWYPWAFWGLTLALRRNPVGYWSLPAVLALTFLTGHPQEWYYLVVALSAWAGAEGVAAWRRAGPREGLVPLATWMALLGLSLGLCAVDLFPQAAAGAWSLKSGAIPLAQMNRYRLHTSNLLQLISPLALGGPQDYFGADNYWEALLSVGLVPLVLAVIGAGRNPERAALRRWLVLVAVAAVFAAGKALGLYALAYKVLPGMERFRVPARTLFLANLGAAVLAGAGVDRLLAAAPDADWRRLRARLWAALIGTAVVVFVTAWIAPGAAAGSHGADKGGWVAEALRTVAGSPGFWIGVVGAIGVVTFAGQRARGPVAAAWGLGMAAVLELTFYAQSLLVCAPVSDFLGGDWVSQAVRAAEGDGAPPVRVASFGTVYPDLNAAAVGLEKTNVNDSFQIQHAADLYERLYPLLDPCRPRLRRNGPMDAVVDDYRGRVAQAVLDVMAVRYLVTDRPLPLPGFEPFAAVGEGVVLWRNRSALPRAYVVPRGIAAVEVGGGPERYLDGFAPRDQVVMDRDPLPEGDRQPFTPAEWLSRDPDEVVIVAETGAPGLLVVANTWMPGWSATVDGKPASVGRGNHCQQVVALTWPGRHEVVLRYVPPGLAAGRAVSGTSLALWSGFGLVLAARRWRAPRWVWSTRATASPVWSAYRSA
jgi:hypothetical protein